MIYNISSVNYFPMLTPPPHTATRTGAYDDPNGSHISIEVYSELFEGKRPVQRQQLVYKALWEGKHYVFHLFSVIYFSCAHGDIEYLIFSLFV